MVLKVVKKPKAKPTNVAVVSTAKAGKQLGGIITGYEELVDELTTIEGHLAPVRDMLKRETKLASILRDIADKETSAYEPAIVVGTLKNFNVTERSLKRAVLDVEELRKQLGHDLFMKIVSVSLEDIDKYLTEEQKSKVLMESHSGFRRGKLVEKV